MCRESGLHFHSRMHVFVFPYAELLTHEWCAHSHKSQAGKSTFARLIYKVKPRRLPTSCDFHIDSGPPPGTTLCAARDDESHFAAVELSRVIRLINGMSNHETRWEEVATHTHTRELEEVEKNNWIKIYSIASFMSASQRGCRGVVWSESSLISISITTAKKIYIKFHLRSIVVVCWAREKKK